MPVSQNELESYLWGAANLLRGTIDACDYKQYIFPLLFYKRICDIYDEEYRNALKESSGDEEYARLPENHLLQIVMPKGAHWNDTRQASKDIGTALQKSLRELEKVNPDTLFGIFGDAQWSNKDRLPDRTLKDILEHISSIDLSLENVPQDQLGEAYEYLIKKFADDSGHSAAEFYTNRTLVRLMTFIMKPQPGESIYDPTCGSGGMLLVAALQLKEQGKEYRSLKLYGQEINLITSAIAKMNLFLHGIEDFQIARGDTLSNPAFLRNDELMQFDVILANPPYSIKQWNKELWTNDPYGRNIYGTPPQGRADYAFFQHIIKSMNPKTGRCAILFPHGVLFRNEEKEMRKKLIEADIIDCVLGLGPNLFYNSPMEACVIFCKIRKPAKKHNKILFINAVNDIARRNAQSFLEKAHIQKIFDAYMGWKDVEGFARVVPVEEITKNNSSLNISLYIRPQKNGDAVIVSLPNAIQSWVTNSVAIRKSYEKLRGSLREVGLDE
jgi:type I restriction enzyme M protein